MEDNKVALQTLIKHLTEDSADQVDRLLRMEATLKSIQGSIEWSEDNLEAMLFTLIRTEQNLVKVKKSVKHTKIWVISGIIFSALCILLSVGYSISTSIRIAKDLEDAKKEIVQNLNKLTKVDNQLGK